MLFIAGFITGILIAILFILTLVFFKHKVEKVITIVEEKVSSAGPKPEGFIILPEDEAEEARQEIIARNKRSGRDTPLSDLQ